MADINFRSKGLNQKIFSKKVFRPTTRWRSKAYNTLMSNSVVSHVMHKASRKRIFWDALKKRGQGSSWRGFTKKDMKKVLGDMADSGEFMHKEIHHLGQELIGGPANSRIIHDHGSQQGHADQHGSNGSAPAAPEKPKVNMGKIYQEIMDKSPHRTNANAEIKEKEKANPTGKVDFSVSNKNVRSIEGQLEQRNQSIHMPVQNLGQNVPKAASVAGFLRKYGQHEDIAKVKSMLANIQDSSEEDFEDTA